MKMKQLLITFSLVMGSVLHAQELPYKVSYQDRGPVIHHATCRLVVLNNNNHFGSRDYLNQEFINLLALKGYRIYHKNSHNFQFGRTSFTDAETKKIQQNDLALKMTTLQQGKTHSQLGELGLVSNFSFDKEILEIEALREFQAFGSKTFKMSPNRVLISGGEDEFFVGSPQTIDSKKGRKTLFEVYDSLPSCISEDSGHHYVEDKYNEEIVRGEINSCIGLYKQDLRRLSKSGSSLELMFSNFGGYVLTAAGFTIAPVALPVGVGILGFNTFKKYDRKILKKQLKDSISFMEGVSICYDKITAGESCKDLSNSVNLKKNKKSVQKYLELAGSEEFTQKIADYLGSSRACSYGAKKIRKLQVKTMLKEVGKTL